MNQTQTNTPTTNQAVEKQYTPSAGGGQSQPATLYKRIGSTNYRVNVHFSGTSRETIDEKITRLIQREAGQ